ncbi:PHA/PHB synthase family protein [Pseudoduganella namucuonensis]|uniref:Polyhydroxyalkanoate synthase n=1 Tax=Pseudoduganella namucuonensis TaxID=1035707 RepID=A0A1I7KP04_9BURK|nr:alpha/beta fold hydrolase [Pseudoduganella namucuonensis]SFU99173.1 polyhydroxyalkanoate synthase [Pseudoduganella namucuonensis]
MNAPEPAAAPVERAASAWQDHGKDATRQREWAHWDLLLNAWLGKATGHLSPVGVGLAYADWLAHLALSPSKRAELAGKAVRKLMRWQRYALHPALAGEAGESGEAESGVEPLPQDQRFSDPAWRRAPYDLLAQAFLLQQQWWHIATTGVRGVSRHHEDIVNFTVRQFLDMLAPSNFVLTNPVVLDETMRRGGANLVNGAAAALADWRRQQSGGSERFRPGAEVAATPGRVVFRNRLIELLQYAPAGERAHARPLLIVPAWIMKYYILDLSPHNSLVRYLVERGHTVFMISWKNPDAGDRDLSLEDYRCDGVMAALAEVARITGAARVNAAGYCLGGTLLAIAAAAMARDGDERLASMTLLAAQTDFTEPGELSLFIDESQVSFLEASMWEQGYLDTRQMAGAFQMLRSNDLIWSRRLRHYLLDEPQAETDLMAWNADATRMPCRMHSEYLRRLFLDNELARGRYLCDGRPVSLGELELPVLAVATTTDHVAPWRSVYKLLQQTSTDATFLLTTGGHNAGVVSPPGRAGREFRIARRVPGAPYADADAWLAQARRGEGSWWPVWESWLAAQAGPMAPPPPMGPDLGAAPGTYVLQR